VTSQRRRLSVLHSWPAQWYLVVTIKVSIACDQACFFFLKRRREQITPFPASKYREGGYDRRLRFQWNLNSLAKTFMMILSIRYHRWLLIWNLRSLRPVWRELIQPATVNSNRDCNFSLLQLARLWCCCLGNSYWLYLNQKAGNFSCIRNEIFVPVIDKKEVVNHWCMYELCPGSKSSFFVDTEWVHEYEAMTSLRGMCGYNASDVHDNMGCTWWYIRQGMCQGIPQGWAVF